MGIYSTCEITKEDALKYAMEGIFSCSDDELESILFALYGDKTLNNFQIVADYSSDWPYKYGREEREEY